MRETKLKQEWQSTRSMEMRQCCVEIGASADVFLRTRRTSKDSEQKLFQLDEQNLRTN